jgi:hypothetical protein
MRYRVRDNHCIEHEGKRYEGGELVDLETPLAVFHEPNIEVIKDSPKPEETEQEPPWQTPDD